MHDYEAIWQAIRVYLCFSIPIGFAMYSIRLNKRNNGRHNILLLLWWMIGTPLLLIYVWITKQ